MKPKIQPQLDQKEMKQLLEGATEERVEGEEQQSNLDTVKGVGFQRSGSLPAKPPPEKPGDG